MIARRTHKRLLRSGTNSCAGYYNPSYVSNTNPHYRLVRLTCSYPVTRSGSKVRLNCFFVRSNPARPWEGRGQSRNANEKYMITSIAENLVER
jgi:hypothetical protein